MYNDQENRRNKNRHEYTFAQAIYRKRCGRVRSCHLKSVPDIRTGGETRIAMNKFVLKLYVTGDTQRSERAISNLRQICERELHDQYELVIVDVLEHPQLAEEEKIMVTPTLVRELPPPRRRIIGDLTDTARVLLGLNLQQTVEQRGEEQ